MEEQKKYNYGIDIIRIIAMMLVVVVHSTTFNNWISSEVSIVNFFVGAGRFLAFTCVPLFIVLTGYLTKNKTPNAKYYKKIIRVLLEYLICSVLIGIFKIFYLNQEFTIWTFCKGILYFNLADYSWYINMYIGLFLLAPFFNILYNNLANFKIKTLLIIILVTVFALPGTTKIFSWNYWTVGYPIMYYFIGCYLKDVNLEFKRKNLYMFLALIFLIGVETLITIFQVDFIVTQNYENVFCVFVTVLLFLLLKDLFVIRKNKVVKLCRAIANVSLSFFLLSCIFDNIFSIEVFYKLKLVSFAERLPHLFYTVPLTIVGSIILALIVHFVTGLISKIIDKLITKVFCKKKENLSQE